MKIRNLTDKLQCICAVELAGSREFSIYIEPNGVNELEGLYIPDLRSLKGIIEIEGVEMQSVSHHSEETPSVEHISEAQHEDAEEDPIPVSENFICEICGAEFGSSRSLNTHRSRAHQK